jgi:iron complex outermembrane receptor protein
MPMAFRRRPRAGRAWLALAFVILVAAPVSLRAQTTAPELTRLSIEDLLNIEVTSASRKEQRVMDVAAAVFVITQEDIRRSGMTTIPDLLRLVPGVNVAQINSNKWAVSVRGFNGLFANKLLVLIDGRSVYNQLYSGVIWDTVDLMADDIDRIEVIRGPGATAWGANAMNGVINIVTRSAADSQGGVVRMDAGGNGTQAALRYGGTAFNTPYRVFAQWTSRDESILVPGVRANDASHSVTAGFRADRSGTRGEFTLTGKFTAGRSKPLWLNLDAATAATQPVLGDSSETRAGHLLGRWASAPGAGVHLQVQSSIDLANLQEAVGHFTRRAIGVEAQARKTVAGRHDLVTGVGYRHVDERLDGRNHVSLIPADNHSILLTAFIQDDVAMPGDRVHLILGTQFQHDSQFGAGIQPSVRLMWNVRPRQRLWAAASRAIRTPSLADRFIRVDYPPQPTPIGLPLFATVIGNPDVGNETFADLEAGYRIEAGASASIDATAFAGRYTDLITNEVSAPVLVFAPGPRLEVTSRNRNQMTATTRGVEVAAHWAPAATVWFDASIAMLQINTRLRDAAGTVAADVPRMQWQARAVFQPAPRATITASLFHVGRLRVSAVEAYTRADVMVEWRVSDRLALMAIGQNLLQASHAEFIGTNSLLLSTRMPRSLGVRARWMF